MKPTFVGIGTLYYREKEELSSLFISKHMSENTHCLDKIETETPTSQRRVVVNVSVCVRLKPRILN